MPASPPAFPVVNERLAELIRQSGAAVCLTRPQAAPTLSERLGASGRLTPTDWLALAHDLARALSLLHLQGVQHRAIQPTNVLWSADAPPAMLTGFERASTSAQELQGFIHHKQLALDLAYCAPEQTGRSGMGIDHRADLYALGCTLFAAATGHPPFQSDDPLTLIHLQLAEPAPDLRSLLPDVPAALAAVVTKLLEKSPDDRYQSAQGLLVDIKALRNRLQEHGDWPEGFKAGQHDHPDWLTPPGRLTGRDHEQRLLAEALERALHTPQRAVLVAGAPGVGKTALINTLRPLVTERRGWFISAKFDQVRQDAGADGMRLALRALGRLVLSESEHDLQRLRQQLTGVLGTQAHLITEMLPEFEVLLGNRKPGGPTEDPMLAEARSTQAIVALMRQIVSPTRPLVMFIDDLQWAGAPALRTLDALITDKSLRGLLLVGAFRQGEVDATHVLSTRMAQWSQLPHGPQTIPLLNLPAGDLNDFLASMLRLPPEQTQSLTHAVASRTGGNPFDTVELINALRREQLLSLDVNGWHWQADEIGKHVSQHDVLELLQARLKALPETTLALLRDMACLGGELQLSVLAQACALPPAELEAAAAPALDQGLIKQMDDAERTWRFRHDRVQQATLALMPADAQQSTNLALARRLRELPNHQTLAAEQYLQALPLLQAPAERLSVAQLLLGAAIQIRQIHHDSAATYCDAALSLVGEASGDAALDDLRAALYCELHVARYNLGQLDAADAAFAALQRLQPPVLRWVDNIGLQLSSLTHRARGPEAVALGTQTLASLGHPVPDNIEQDLHQTLLGLQRDCHPDLIEAQAERDLGQAEAPDPTNIAIAQLLDRLLIPSLQCAPAVYVWLAVASRHLWISQGPNPALVRAASLAIPLVLASRLGAYREARAMARHAVRVGEARRYIVATATARHVYAIATQHWGGPVEDSIFEARQAHDSLVRGGDLQFACLTYHATAPALLDSAPLLQTTADDLAAGLAFAQRTGNQFAQGFYLSYRQLVRVLQTDHVDVEAPGSFQADDYDEAARESGRLAVGTMGAVYRVLRALSAALFGDMPRLKRHIERAMPMLVAMPGFHPTAWAHALHALALIDDLQQGAGCDGSLPDEAQLSGLDAEIAWLGQRADDQPENYRALHQWIAAERAALMSQPLQAQAAFEAAIAHAADRRPWQHGLILERAARCHAAMGLATQARLLREQAMTVWAEWGAQAKVRHLVAQHPELEAKATPGAQHGADASAKQLDLMAVVRASQLLSSETNLQQLAARVQDVLGAMTGATIVTLLLRTDLGQGRTVWHGLDEPLPDDTASSVEASPTWPVAAFRYVERTQAPLTVDNALDDDRFASSGRYMGLRQCSAMVLPVLNQGKLLAMLLLECDLGVRRFASEQLDAAQLVAAQLAVSLENAKVYAELEARVQARTAELRTVQASLVDTARRAGMAEIASNILHNVGNVLNSVNVSADLIGQRLRQTKSSGFGKAVQLMAEHEHDLGRFFTEDDKGKRLPGYLNKLVSTVSAEQADMLQELDLLIQRVDHIKGIVAMQQSYAGTSCVLDSVRIAELIQDALQMNESALVRHKVKVHSQIADLPAMQLDRSRILQILMNLLSNAKQACSQGHPGEGQIWLTADERDGMLHIEVKDDGIGIPPENLTRVFAHGFTTKRDGHGFGLHSCVLAAKDMGGSLEVHSEGAGQGATFILKIPAEYTSQGLGMPTVTASVH